MNFPGDIVGPQARAAIAAMPPGGLVMLENLRFDEAETSKDDMARGYFADRLAAPVDLYVADGSAPCTASTPASTTCRCAAPAPSATWSRPRSPRCAS